MTPYSPGAGQVVMPTAGSDLVRPEQASAFSRLSDPALSEFGLDELLDELLRRVHDALAVDTVAILLLDEAKDELVARAARGIEEEVEAGVRIPIGRGFAGRIAYERVAIFIEDVDHADILNPILREKGICSLLGLPLIAEGKLIGVLHIGSLTPRKFDQRDLSLLEVAAARAAPGIERAQLYSQFVHEHRVVVALQRSLLPKTLAKTPGFETAARYLAASDGVGGDWYDVFELPGGRVGVTIGDVVGHGIGAAALMGQLRTALHAYAAQGSGPAQTLELVNRFMQSLPVEAMATAAYAVLDPDRGELRIAAAGHLPPLVVGNGAAKWIELPPSPPLGAFPYGRALEERDIPLSLGEALVLYTDGLVERSGVPLDASLQALIDVVAEASNADEICKLALEMLVEPSEIRDDVAIVVIQYAGLPAELDLQLDADPRVLVQVRRILRRWLRERGADEAAVVDVTMAVSEGCANAIEHAYSPLPARFSVRAATDSDPRDGTPRVTIAITDGGNWRAPRGESRGRGLKIIEAAMDSVEISADARGTKLELQRRIRDPGAATPGKRN